MYPVYYGIAIPPRTGTDEEPIHNTLMEVYLILIYLPRYRYPFNEFPLQGLASMQAISQFPYYIYIYGATGGLEWV